MAVVCRKRKNGKPTYYVTIDWNGKRYWERSGHEVREARRLNKQRLTELRDGRFTPRQISSRITLSAFAETWLKTRKSRWADGERYLRAYVLERDWISGMKLEDIRKVHGRRLVDELKAVVSEKTGKALSEKTVANILGVTRTMFQSAIDKELATVNPFSLPRGTLVLTPTVRRGTYGVEAIRSILSSPDVAVSAKVFAALAFYTGMREGEICGRRWRDLDLNPAPLGCLTVSDQYDGRPLKTEKVANSRGRVVPVHPDLAVILDAWRATGWVLLHQRAPEPDDFLVPARGLGAHTKSSAYKMWRKACVSAGVDNVSLHSTRHTFLSLARRGGARKEVIERVTHNAKGDIVDSYTHWDWAPLCEAVSCLVIGVKPGEVLVTHMVTSAHTMPILSVEAPGIESGTALVTDGNYSGPTQADAPTEPPRQPPNAALFGTECAALHHRPSASIRAFRALSRVALVGWA